MTEGRPHEPAPDASSGGGPVSKVLIALLAVSVSINLLVAGMVVGQHLGGSHSSFRIDASHDANNGRGGGPYDTFVRNAPEAVLPFLKEAIASHQDLSQIQFQQLRDARHEAIRQLKAQPFDPAAADAAFQKMRTLIGEIQRGVHESALGAYARAYGMPPVSAGGDAPH
ncbi:MAG: periplasmic heavy metal sensor [Azospirillaceae bacterium]|nr:periplasmic heavy metal sensor [Azospirillaceae bacterium]